MLHICILLITERDFCWVRGGGSKGMLLKSGTGEVQDDSELDMGIDIF